MPLARPWHGRFRLLGRHGTSRPVPEPPKGLEIHFLPLGLKNGPKLSNLHRNLPFSASGPPWPLPACPEASEKAGNPFPVPGLRNGPQAIKPSSKFVFFGFWAGMAPPGLSQRLRKGLEIPFPPLASRMPPQAMKVFIENGRFQLLCRYAPSWPAPDHVFV